MLTSECDIKYFSRFSYHLLVYLTSRGRLRLLCNNELLSVFSVVVYNHDVKLKITEREKEKDLNQSYDTSPYTNTATEEFEKQHDNTKTQPNTSITRWLRIDLGLSVRVTTTIQLVWFNRFTGSQPSH